MDFDGLAGWVGGCLVWFIASYDVWNRWILTRYLAKIMHPGWELRNYPSSILPPPPWHSLHVGTGIRRISDFASSSSKFIATLGQEPGRPSSEPKVLPHLKLTASLMVMGFIIKVVNWGWVKPLPFTTATPAAGWLDYCYSLHNANLQERWHPNSTSKLQTQGPRGTTQSRRWVSSLLIQ